jgi:methylisocitrate lyase
MGNNSPGRILRTTIEDATIPVPGAHNALTGMLIERLGFSATYLSGAAFSASVLGLPDIGLFTLTELVQHTAYLTRRIGIPVIVDADTGFGDAMHVQRTVIELEAAGAAAIQLEDQVLPKRCGHLSGKQLCDTDAMCAKIHAAIEARQDPDLVIVARTDARGVTGLEDAIARSRRYIDAGADWIFPEALESREEFIEFADAIETVPLVANMTEFGKSPLMNVQEFANLDYAVVLYPVTLLRVAMKAMHAVLQMLSEEGTQEACLDVMMTRAQLYELLDYEGFAELDRQFFERGTRHE